MTDRVLMRFRFASSPQSHILALQQGHECNPTATIQEIQEEDAQREKNRAHYSKEVEASQTKRGT